MRTESNELMGQIRSMLHQPRPDATQIIQTIQQCPDAHARAIAERYAHEHFVARHEQEDIPDYQPRLPVSRMRYDPRSGILYHPDGSSLKQMCCPLEQRWSDLTPLHEDDRVRRCRQCQHNVHDTRDMDPDELRELLQKYPQTCLHIDPRHGHVLFMNASHEAPNPSQPESELITIHTAFSYQEINTLTSIGYTPLIKSMIPEESGNFIQVWQHTITKHIHVQMDTRCVTMPPPYNDWEVILTSSSYHPHQSVAFAAYMIPRDIAPNTPVHIKQSIHAPPNTPGAAPSLASATGWWTGSDIILEPAPPPPSRHVYG